jgi:transposase
MITKKDNDSLNVCQIVSIDNLVPKDHLVRKINKAIDFEFIREKVKHLYSDVTGRPSIDPVVLFKIVFIQFMFGIRSMRKTISEIEVNAAYRWFLGFTLTDEVPHYSTFSQNYRRRFADSNIFNEIFETILQKVIDNGFIKEDTIFVDSTHIKAYANKRKSYNAYVKEDVNKYVEKLHKELNEIRVQEGKKEIDFIGTKQIAVSKTDPECGMFHKGEKEKQFAYSVQTACDENGWILGCETNAGNINDNNGGAQFVLPYLDNHEKVDYVVLDAGYTGSVLMDGILKKGRIPVVPYTRPKGSNTNEFYKKDYKYDSSNNEYTCPFGKKLKYKGVNTQGYLTYQSKKSDCMNCPLKDKCTKSSIKTITRHLLEYTKDVTRDIRLSDIGKAKYQLRKTTIERAFADGKMNHNLGFTLVRGLKKNSHRNLIVFAMANLKKFANLIDRLDRKYENSTNITNLLLKFYSKLFKNDFLQLKYIKKVLIIKFQ